VGARVEPELDEPAAARRRVEHVVAAVLLAAGRGCTEGDGGIGRGRAEPATAGEPGLGDAHRARERRVQRVHAARRILAPARAAVEAFADAVQAQVRGRLEAPVAQVVDLAPRAGQARRHDTALGLQRRQAPPRAAAGRRAGVREQVGCGRGRVGRAGVREQRRGERRGQAGRDASHRGAPSRRSGRAGRRARRAVWRPRRGAVLNAASSPGTRLASRAGARQAWCRSGA
jgi:hypothetical protein